MSDAILGGITSRNSASTFPAFLHVCGVPRRANAADPAPDLELFVPEPKSEFPSKHVPRLIVLMVDVEWRNPVVAHLGRPLRDDEAVAKSTENPAR